MKVLTKPNPVALIEATREEYQAWLSDMAAGGVTLPGKGQAWCWISPTGLCFLFLEPPEKNQLTASQIDTINNVMRDVAESTGYTLETIRKVLNEYPDSSTVTPRAMLQEATP